MRTYKEIVKNYILIYYKFDNVIAISRLMTSFLLKNRTILVI